MPQINDPTIDLSELQGFKNVKEELTIHSAGALLRGSLVVIPANL